jgi:hypothetical protein
MDEVLAIGSEPATSTDEDALLDGGEEDLFFDFEDGFGFCCGVLAPVDFEPELRYVS